MKPEELPYPLDAKEIWMGRSGQLHINPKTKDGDSIFFTLSDLCDARNLLHTQAARIAELEGLLSVRSEELEISHSCNRLEREMHEKELVRLHEIHENEKARLNDQAAALSKAVIDIQEERDLAQAEFRTYHQAWEEQAAHIRELEEQLSNCRAAKNLHARREEKLLEQVATLKEIAVEERGRALWFQGDDPNNPVNLDWKNEPNTIPESIRLIWEDAARRQLLEEHPEAMR